MSTDLPGARLREEPQGAEQFRALLVAIAAERFHVPRPDAEGLAQEVLVAYLGAAERVHDVRAWLVGAIYNASRYYWRREERYVPLPAEAQAWVCPETADLEERLATCISVRQALAQLDRRCQDVLRLRFAEGYKLHELASTLGTTVASASRAVLSCLRRLKSAYTRLFEAKA